MPNESTNFWMRFCECEYGGREKSLKANYLMTTGRSNIFVPGNLKKALFFFPDENLFYPDAKKMSLFPRCQNFIESLFFPDAKKMSLFPRGQNLSNLVFFHVFVAKSIRQSLKLTG